MTCSIHSNLQTYRLRMRRRDVNLSAKKILRTVTKEIIQSCSILVLFLLKKRSIGICLFESGVGDLFNFLFVSFCFLFGEASERNIFLCWFPDFVGVGLLRSDVSTDVETDDVILAILFTFVFLSLIL
mmetsp:Transcript_15793/g.36567  ORF Transcript_15793/g.36567 Transcript_15793/m.36567 type:complete len:128 (+) Transcript_15793:27-410(+)